MAAFKTRSRQFVQQPPEPWSVSSALKKMGMYPRIPPSACSRTAFDKRAARYAKPWPRSDHQAQLECLVDKAELLPYVHMLVHFLRLRPCRCQ